MEHASDTGIRCLTLYAFSSDNWRRPPAEVRSIFWLLRAFLRAYGTLWSHGVVDQATKEAGRLRNARVVDCGL